MRYFRTWLADTEEPTFEDLTNGTGEKRLGYEKIRFCGKQARQDGLQYFWVDTCCICVPTTRFMPPFLEASAARNSGVHRNFSFGIGEYFLQKKELSKTILIEELSRSV
jgi:hypothetical protein